MEPETAIAIAAAVVAGVAAWLGDHRLGYAALALVAAALAVFFG